MGEEIVAELSSTTLLCFCSVFCLVVLFYVGKISKGTKRGLVFTF